MQPSWRVNIHFKLVPDPIFKVNGISGISNASTAMYYSLLKIYDFWDQTYLIRDINTHHNFPLADTEKSFI